MRYFWLFILGFALASNLVAQGELDDFDFFEQKEEEEEDYFKDKKDAEKSKEKAKKKKKKAVRAAGAYYHIPGNMMLHTGFHFINSPRSIAIPHSTELDMTVLNNLSVGFRFTRFRYKTSEPVDSSISTATAWLSRDKWIDDHSFLVTLTYHMSELFGLDPEKYDIYVKGYYGSNSVKGDWSFLGLDPESLTKTIITGAVGGRYIYNHRFSLWADLGRSRYGIMNFGVTYKLLDMRF